MNNEERLVESMQQIASAVKAATGMNELKASIAQLTTAVKSSLSEQQRLNNRFEQQMESFGRFERDARERLVCTEQAAKDLPNLRQRIDGLERKLAYYVGLGTGIGVVVSVIVNQVLK